MTNAIPCNKIADDALVKAIITNDTTRIVFSAFQNRGINLIRLNKDYGVNSETGEVIEFKHTQNRSERSADFRRSLARLHDLIQTNVVDTRKCYFLTLT